MYQPQDFFFNKAKKEGYPARSVYKLKELDKKYNLFQPGQSILDLGCAPGSWSIYIGQQINPGGKILGIDKQKVDIKIVGSFFIQEDIFKISFEELRKIMSQIGIRDNFHGIVSDMAPAMSGIKILDAGRSAELAKRVIDLAENFLKPEGFLVLKVMEGGEHDIIRSRIRNLFKWQKQIRPKAVRRNSREIYIIANGFKRD